METTISTPAAAVSPKDTTAMAHHTPHFPTPGRYAVLAYVGRKPEELHRWRRRRDAEETAGAVLEHSFSTDRGTRYKSVEVYDRVNRTVIYQKQRPQKRRG